MNSRLAMLLLLAASIAVAAPDLRIMGLLLVAFLLDEGVRAVLPGKRGRA